MQIKERRSEMGDKITKSPKIRFVGFTDAWEERKFIELLDIREGIRRGPFGSALKKELFVPKSDYVVYEQQNAIYDKWETRYNITKDKFDELRKFVLSEGDFIMSGAGTIGRISRVPNGIKQGVFNQALIRFKINTEVTNSNYFLEWIRSDNMQRKFTEANPGSAMTNLVPMHEVKEWVVSSPSLGEQKKIGDFFTELSYLLTLHQRKLELLKDMKKSLLQKMFPKDGANVPEIRFAGFTDAWEQHRLGEMLEERNEQIPENEEYSLMSFVQGTGVTPKVDRYDRNFLVKDVNKKYKKTELGDFIYSSNNLETGSIGFNKTGKAVISPVYSVFSSKNKMESQFIGILSTRKDFIGKMLRFRQGVVYGQWRIHEKDFLDIQITVPSHDEQKEIIGFFVNLDNLITLHRRELNLIKNLKKSLLQQMFI
ncbi:MULTISPECIES: restriction endonuclease subunit S [Bacillus]|uniref:restriction endonuclease subunit S n=1 Tax=Bacillus TaxID=1386 RepID=UPI0018D4B2D8|nr:MULTISPECIES: restriction endonuclease subunit S [Bacillus]MDJ0286783.1 restriction endonuclease subunit S [Bacillus altitudinis]USK23675.1 restriction endonuclease subunit S [Bacillus altitudinis]